MRRKDKEITDKALIEKILKDAVICRIAMADGEQPYIVPMNFGYDGQYLYLHCAREGRKLELLRNNNRVCFEVEEDTAIIASGNACDWTMKYLCVIGTGRAVLVQDNDEKRQAFEIIMRKYSRIMEGESARTSFEFPDKLLNAVEVLRIEIEELSGKKSGM